MMTHEAHEVRSSAGHPRRHRLLPIVGSGVAVAVVLAHLAGGGVLMHVGLPALLVYLGLGAVPTNLAGGALVVGLAAIITIKLLFVFVFGGTLMSKTHAGITTGKTIHRPHFYDAFVALLTLGRARTLRDRTVALARIAPGEAVLDVGCGTGEIAMRAKARSGTTGSVVGIDPAPEMIAVARQKAAQVGVEIDYRVAAVEALPFVNATFDVVVSSLMLHHLPEDLKPRALAEIRRVLKPGGRLVVVDFKQPTSRLGRLAPVWLLHRSVEDHSSLQELPALLTAAGFSGIESRDTGVGYLGCVHAHVDR
jgi:demethylmenaquinone methyltransferase/2-methoxy-6-polyprenyl-1,4-benzoquinol methylase/phosphoethanolamine N-methyltransferase